MTPQLPHLEAMNLPLSRRALKNTSPATPGGGSSGSFSTETYRGRVVLESPPNSSGHVLLQELNLLEGFDLAATPTVSVQVMHQVAAADDKHSFVAQAGEPFRDFVVEFCRLRLVNAELDNRHVCFRKHVTEYRPCAMVQAPPFIQVH